MATWSMGPGTLEVPSSLYANNRQRLTEKLSAGQIVVLQGGDEISHYDTDVAYVFRQEAYFTWICGVREPGCYFALDVSTRKSYLFVPRLSPDYEIWMGKLLSCDDFKDIYGVDEVRFVDELWNVLSALKPVTLLTLKEEKRATGTSWEVTPLPTTSSKPEIMQNNNKNIIG